MEPRPSRGVLRKAIGPKGNEVEFLADGFGRTGSGGRVRADEEGRWCTAVGCVAILDSGAGAP